VPQATRLASGTSVWLDVSFDGLSGSGTVSPVVLVQLLVQTPQGVEVELHRCPVRLLFNNELVASGELGPARVSSYPFNIPVSLPLNPRSLSFIDDNARGDDLFLKLELTGLLRVKQEEPRGPRPSQPEIPYGEWGFVVVGPADLSFRVARSDWYSKVVAVVGAASYTSIDLVLPKLVPGSGITAALDRLREAEQAYVAGDDAKAFLACRGMLEALPGYPRDITGAIGDPRKREAVDALIKEVETSSTWDATSAAKARRRAISRSIIAMRASRSTSLGSCCRTWRCRTQHRESPELSVPPL